MKAAKAKRHSYKRKMKDHSPVNMMKADTS